VYSRACDAAEFQWDWLRPGGEAFTRFAIHRTQAILFVGALPLIVRIALLPVLGPAGPVGSR
jgi:hypothetical protein